MHSHLKTIEYLGEVDVSHYIDLFTALDDNDLMNAYNMQNKKFIPPLRDVDQIPLLLQSIQDTHKNIEDFAQTWTVNDIIRFVDEGPIEYAHRDSKPQLKGKFFDKYYNKKFFDSVDDILTSVYGEGRITMMTINVMQPNSEISIHKDETTRGTKRIHIPVITHPDVKVFNDPDEIHMEVGGMYRLNHYELHWVKNPTDIERVHIVVDWRTYDD